MKKIDIAFLIIVLMATLFVSFSCESAVEKQTMVAEPKEEIVSEPKRETEREQNQKEIDDYRKELKDWNDYNAELENNVYPLMNEARDLDDKRIEAIEVEDYKKAESYREVLIDKNQEIIEALYETYVPEIAKEYHDYFTNAFLKYKEWLVYMGQVNRDLEAGIYNFDEVKAESLIDSSHHLLAQRDQEGLRIQKQFNQRAKELGLEISYPGLN